MAVLDKASVAQLVDGYRGPGLDIDVAALFGAGDREVVLLGCAICTLKWYAPGRAGDAAFYVALQAHDWYYQPDKAEYGYARSHLPDKGALLEVGCGSGAFALRLPTGLRYRGLEFNARAVEKARAAGLDVEIRALADECRSHPRAYDVVCHFQVLEHVPDPAAFMADCAALLRPGGSLIVAVPAEDSFVGLAESNWLNMPPHHLSRWTDGALRSAFERIDVEPRAWWHEPVAVQHRAWQRATAISSGWLGLRGKLPRLVARRTGAPLRVARRLPIVADWLAARGLQRNPQLARGHSVCVVGRKR